MKNPTKKTTDEGPRRPESPYRTKVKQDLHPSPTAAEVPVHQSLVTLRAALPVVLSGVRTEVTPEQMAAAEATIAKLEGHEIKPYAENSRRSMQADWSHWLAFCDAEDRVCMPISFDDLVEFTKSLIGAGYKRSTIEHHLYTLKMASRLWGCVVPTEQLEFKWFWKEQCRTALVAKKRQAAGLTRSPIKKLVASTNEDPGIFELMQLRDTAFVAVAYDIMARGAEMVCLKWEHLTFDEDGDATCTIVRSKTDQSGEGADLHITQATAALVRSWQMQRLKAADLLWPEARLEYLRNPFVFHRLPRYRMFQPKPADEETRLHWDSPLTVREANRMVKRAAGERFSSHSTRVGATQDMVAANMDLPAIMRQGRWTTPTMPARYAEKELAKRSGRSREAALQKLDES